MKKGSPCRVRYSLRNGGQPSLAFWVLKVFKLFRSFRSASERVCIAEVDYVEQHWYEEATSPSFRDAAALSCKAFLTSTCLLCYCDVVTLNVRTLEVTQVGFCLEWLI